MSFVLGGQGFDGLGVQCYACTMMQSDARCGELVTGLLGLMKKRSQHHAWPLKIKIQAHKAK